MISVLLQAQQLSGISVKQGVLCLTGSSLDTNSMTFLYIAAKKIQGWTKSIQTPVPFRPPAGKNPDWSITMIFM